MQCSVSIPRLSELQSSHKYLTTLKLPQCSSSGPSLRVLSKAALSHDLSGVQPTGIALVVAQGSASRANPQLQWNVWLQAWNQTLSLPKIKGFIVYPWKGQKAGMRLAIGCGVTIQYWKVEKSRQIIIRKDIILFIPFCQSCLAMLYYTFFSWNELDLSFKITNTCPVFCKYTVLKAICSETTGIPYQELLFISHPDKDSKNEMHVWL